MSDAVSSSPAAELRVGGVTPFTTIDFPGRLAAVVYVQGCPWRCGYCHNPHLQPRDGAGHDWPAVLAWLRRRRGLLDGVVFSGGEPTLDPGLGRAVDAVREAGYAVALHTAGIYPRRLAELLPRLEWVGLDVKAPLSDDALHDRITGVAGGADAVRRSLGLLRGAGVAHECRTTAHPQWLVDEALIALADDLARRGVDDWVVQAGRPTPDAAAPPSPPAPSTWQALRQRLPRVRLRI